MYDFSNTVPRFFPPLIVQLCYICKLIFVSAILYSQLDLLWLPVGLTELHNANFIQVINSRGNVLQCSHYGPAVIPEGKALPCVIYCHGNRYL